MSEINNNNEYIPRAERRNKDGLTEKEFLEQYNPGHYERPSVTVDMLLFGISRDLKCLKVLLIKRNNHPYIDCYALPGGFVNITESAYTAAPWRLFRIDQVAINYWQSYVIFICVVLLFDLVIYVWRGVKNDAL